MKADRPVLFLILDGFGVAPDGPDNAVHLAEPRFFQSLKERSLYTTLLTSGLAVGLPEGQMGNSEVGHLTLGAGRTVYQDLTRIDLAIEDGSMAENEALRRVIERATKNASRVHLLGLVSDGGVHSSLEHLSALIENVQAGGLGERLHVHAFLDGRDTPPRSAKPFLTRIEALLRAKGGSIATISGRYYAMDRDKRWDRVKRAWDALVLGRAEEEEDPIAALDAAYARNEGDEFVAPTKIQGTPRIEDGDEILFFNFRADRARELSEAFLFEDFDGFDRETVLRTQYTTMTEYRSDFPCPVLFGRQDLENILSTLVADAGMRQLRIAETEKYAHVTFFFGGGREEPLPLEERCLIPSPDVATYDLAPEMSAAKVTDALLARMEDGLPDLVVLNYANGDMVGHTGILDAAVQAVKTLDSCLERLVPAWTERGGVIALTADHGNCEQMLDPASGQPHTAHTLNPVPFLLHGAGIELGRSSLRSDGTIADIAPTLCPFLGLERPPEMGDRSLLV